MDVLIAIIIYSCCLFFRKSKLVTIISFIFLWTLWGWNTWNGDYDSYEKVYFDSYYNNTEFSNMEFGYIWIVRFFYGLGFTFQEFMIIISGIILSINLYFTLKLAKYPALFSFFYFFIFVMEFVFIRNYIADTLLLLAFLIGLGNRKFSKLIAIAIVLLASTVHYTALIYLVFLYPFYLKKTFNLSKSVLFFLGMMFLSSISLTFILPFLGQNYISKLSYYTSDSFWLISIAHLLMVVGVVLFFERLKVALINLNKDWIYLFNFIINLNIISLFYLSLYYHVPYFSRVLKLLLAINTIVILSSFCLVRGKNLIKKLTIPVLLFFALFFVYYSKTNFPFTITPLFKCNIIWGDEFYIPEQ